MCRVLGRVPTVGTFRRLYVNSISNGWVFLFIVGGVDDHAVIDIRCIEEADRPFFWIKRFGFAASLLYDLVGYLETFLCFVDLSHSFTEIDVHPTLLHNNDEGRNGFIEFCLNSRILLGKDCLVDHTIQDELNVNVGKRKKRMAFVSGSPPVKKARTEGVVISDSWPSTEKIFLLIADAY
ncbi:hypothetical protein Tco_0268849 [Tanacetum coccineum]